MKTVLLRLPSGLFFHVLPLDLVGRTLLGHSATWAPTGRAFWTLDTKPTLPERDEVYVDATHGQLWDFGLLQPLYDEAIQPGALIVEVGANIGTGAVYCGARGAAVLAVEPYAPTYELLCQNIAANNLEAFVYPLKWAAYDKEGRFVVSKEPSSLDYDAEIILGGVEFAPTDGEGVPGGPLDQVVPMYSLGKRVTLIKTDAQGCDYAALRGLERTIREHKPVIVFEREEQHGIPLRDYEQYLARLGYSVEESVMEGNYVARLK